MSETTPDKYFVIGDKSNVNKRFYINGSNGHVGINEISQDNDALRVNGNLNTNSLSVTEGNTNLASNLTVKKNTILEKNLTVTGDASFNSITLKSTTTGTNINAILGNGKFGNIGENGTMGISNKDLSETSSYAVKQNSLGETSINAASNQRILFCNNNTTKMTIKNTGEVGIGTEDPSGDLHIYGNTASHGSAIIEGIGINSSAFLDLKNTAYSAANSETGGHYRIKSYGGENQNSNVRNGDFAIQQLPYGSTSSADVVERFTISDEGNVGIGTTSPSELLHLKSTTGSVRLRIEADNQQEMPSILMTQNQGSHFHSFGGVASSSGHTNDNSLRIETGADQGANVGSIVFATGGTTGTGSGSERMRIEEDGNVGIGTTSPQNTLDVNGSTNISGTLNLSSTGTGLSVTGNASVGGTLEVIDTLTVSKTTGTGLSVAKNASVGGTLEVSDTLTVSKTDGTGLSVAKNASVGGTLEVSDTLTVSKTDGTGLSVAGNASVAGTLDVSDTLSLSSTGTGLSVAGNASVAGTLDVSDTLSLSSTGTGLSVAGNASVAGTLDVSDTLSLSSTGTGLSVAGNASVDGNVGIGTTSPGASSTVTIQHDGNGNGQWLYGGALQLVGGTAEQTNTQGILIGVSTSDGYSFFQSAKHNVESNTIALNPRGGNIGIGTTNPSYKLDIDGPMNCTELRIAGNVVSNSDNRIDASKIASGTVTNQEFGFLSGLTENIQNQLDDKITGGSIITIDSTNDLVEVDGTINTKGILWDGLTGNNKPIFYLQKNGNQSIYSSYHRSTVSIAPWSSRITEGSANVDLTNGIFTAPISGKYFISATVNTYDNGAWNDPNVSFKTVQLRINNGTEVNSTTIHTPTHHMHSSKTYTDVVSGVFHLGSGANVHIAVSGMRYIRNGYLYISAATTFSGFLIYPTDTL